MTIDQKTVQHISALARLHIDDAEAQKFAKDLEAILSYVQTLKALDVTSVVATSHVLELENVFREDIVKPSLVPDKHLSYPPEERSYRTYKVPKVIE